MEQGRSEWGKAKRDDALNSVLRVRRGAEQRGDDARLTRSRLRRDVRDGKTEAERGRIC